MDGIRIVILVFSQMRKLYALQYVKINEISSSGMKSNKFDWAPRLAMRICDEWDTKSYLDPRTFAIATLRIGDG